MPTTDRVDRERAKAIDIAVGQIEKQFGKGSIMRLGQSAVTRIPTISTGSISIDYALGVGGVPRGRVPSRGHASSTAAGCSIPRSAIPMRATASPSS